MCPLLPRQQHQRGRVDVTKSVGRNQMPGRFLRHVRERNLQGELYAVPHKVSVLRRVSQTRD